MGFTRLGVISCGEVRLRVVRTETVYCSQICVLDIRSGVSGLDWAIRPRQIIAFRFVAEVPEAASVLQEHSLCCLVFLFS